MKRRDFLRASAGMAGGMVPILAFSESRPCSPPALSVKDGSAVIDECVAPPTGSAPSWFQRMPAKTWYEVAGGPVEGINAYQNWQSTPQVYQRGARIRDVFPIATAAGDPAGDRAITHAYAGACVDQIRGEMILAANGGHSNYYGNEVYACRIRSETPSWVRLTDPTPLSLQNRANIGDKAWLSSNPRGSQNDFKPGKMDADGKPIGNPVSAHNWGKPIFANGRVWLSGLIGTASANSGRTSAIWSFDRDLAAQLGADRASLSYIDAPWTYHGIGLPQWGSAPWPSNYALGEAAAYDPVTDTIWSIADIAAANIEPNDMCFIVVKASPPYTIARVNRVNRDDAPGLGGQKAQGTPSFGLMWSVIAHDLRVLIVAQQNSKNIWVLNLNDLAAGAKRILPTFAPGSEFQWAGGNNPFSWGGVYHPSSRSVLTWELRTPGTSEPASALERSRIRKLKIPADPINGSYQWSIIEAAAGNSVVPRTRDPVTPAPSGTFGRFNIIHDMGDPDYSALVYAADTEGPVFVYKLPRDAA